MKSAFETVSELSSDPGLVGLALTQFATMTAPLGPSGEPFWLLREADRWREPWKFLLGVRDVPKPYRKLFAAADSQRYALLRFSRMAQRTASLNNSQYERLVSASASGNTVIAIRAATRILRAMYRIDRGRFLLRATKRRPKLKADLEKILAEFYKQDTRRLGRRQANKPGKKPTLRDCVRNYVVCERLAFGMACGWMRGDKYGFPGLCFCSDEVITGLLGKLLNLPSVKLGTVRKLRQRLHLKKADVVVRKLAIRTNGTFELLDSQGKPIWR